MRQNDAMLNKFVFMALLPLFLFASCGNGGGDDEEKGHQLDDNTSFTIPETIYIPERGVTFSIVLDGDLPQQLQGEVVDLDAFETDTEEIAALHAKGKKVFAYISVGSWEEYREDSDRFPKEIVGKNYPGWPDEKFLDIRAIDKLAPLMQKRFDMIARKGFDGIEPDNIDIYTEDSDGNNGTGFHISLADAKKYADFLIEEAHKRHLSIGQKNAPELTEAYGDLFDWAILEDPFYEKYASVFKIYTEHDKAVFALSYLDNTTKEKFLNNYCNQATVLGYTAILKDRDLTAVETICPKK